MKDPNMTPIVLSVLGFAAGAEEATKVAALADMHRAARMLARRYELLHSIARITSAIVGCVHTFV
jgi:hypothetical protein